MTPDELDDLKSVLPELSDAELHRRYKRHEGESPVADLYADEMKRRGLDH